MKIHVILFLCFLGTKTSLGESPTTPPDEVYYNDIFGAEDIESNYTYDDINKTLSSLDDRDYDISLEDAEMGVSDASEEIKKLEELAYILQVSRDGYLNTDDLSESELKFLRELDISTYEDLSSQTESILENTMDSIDSLQGRVDEVKMTIEQNLVLDEQDSDTRRELFSAYESVSKALEKEMKQIQILAADIDQYQSDENENNSNPAIALFSPVEELFSENTNTSNLNLTDTIENSFYNYANDTEILPEYGYIDYSNEEYGNRTDLSYGLEDGENVANIKNIGSLNEDNSIKTDKDSNSDAQYLNADTLQAFPDNQLAKSDPFDVLESSESLPNISSPEAFDTKENEDKKSLGYFLNSPDQASDANEQADSNEAVDLLDSLGSETDETPEIYNGNMDDFYEVGGNKYNNDDEYITNTTATNSDKANSDKFGQAEISMDSFTNTKDSDQHEGMYTSPLPKEFDSEGIPKPFYENNDISQNSDLNEEIDSLSNGIYDLNELDLNDLENSFTDSINTDEDPTDSYNGDNSFYLNLPNQNQNEQQTIEEDMNNFMNLPPSSLDFSNLDQDSSSIDVPANQPNSDNTDELYQEIYNSMSESEESVINNEDELTDNGRKILDRIFNINKFNVQPFVNNLPSQSSSIDEEERTNQYISALEELDQELNSEDSLNNNNFKLDSQMSNSEGEEQLLRNDITEENNFMKDEMKMKKDEESNRLSTLQLALIITAAGVPVLLIIALVLYTTLYRCNKIRMPYKVMQNDDVLDKKILPAEGGKDNYSVSV